MDSFDCGYLLGGVDRWDGADPLAVGAIGNSGWKCAGSA